VIKRTHKDNLEWVYVTRRKYKIENLEKIMAEKPLAPDADATNEQKQAYEEAQRAWLLRQVNRDRMLRRLESKAPNQAAHALLVDCTETIDGQKLIRTKYLEACSKKKEDVETEQTIRHDDQRRIFPVIDALFRAAPHLAEAARRYHNGRTYRSGNAPENGDAAALAGGPAGPALPEYPEPLPSGGPALESGLPKRPQPSWLTKEARAAARHSQHGDKRKSKPKPEKPKPKPEPQPVAGDPSGEFAA